MILLAEKFDNYQHKINHKKQMLLDYDNKILKYDNDWFLNEYDRSKYKVIKRRKYLIKSEFGISYLPLRTYKNKLTKEIITPTKTYIDIDKYKNYTNRVKKAIIYEADLKNIKYQIIKHN